jgi:hypothetical protein
MGIARYGPLRARATVSFLEDETIWRNGRIGESRFQPLRLGCYRVEIIRQREVTDLFNALTFSGMSAKGDRQSGENELRDSLGDAFDPIQVPMLEALRRIGAPLSAIELVNVLDGYLTMWEAKDHLEALQKDGVVEPASPDELNGPIGEFDLPYRLR